MLNMESRTKGQSDATSKDSSSLCSTIPTATVRSLLDEQDGGEERETEERGTE
jgi:hypothetical protein